MRRKRSRTLDQSLARIDAILARLELLMATTEELNCALRGKLNRLEAPALH